MIPLCLHIKNFLSYGATVQEISFEPYHLICLSGKNGHGKSALFDAITWSLWGHARKVTSASRADDNLLRLGQTHMMVVFTFICNGNTYRIKREYTKTGSKACSSLEFGILQPESGEYRSLTDKTVRQTQQRIDETIKFTFESFTNSVFLRQSHANEFSKKNPKERKEILASILGLDQYESLRKNALEKIRTATAQYQTLLVMHEKESLECTALEDAPGLLIANGHEQQIIQSALAEYHTRKKEWDLHMHTLQTKKDFAQKCANEIQQMQHEITVLSNAIITASKKWRSQRSALPQKQKDEYHKEAAALVAEIAKHQTLLQQSLILGQQLLAHKQEAAQAEHAAQQKQSAALKEVEIMLDRLMVEKTSLETAYETKKREEQDLVSELQPLEATLLQSEKICIAAQEACPSEQQVTQHEQFLEKGKNIYQQWIARYSMIQTQIAQLEQKKQLCANEQDPSCPLCEQNVSLSRRRFLQQKITDQQNHFVHRAQRLKRLIPTLKTKLLEKHTELGTLKEQCAHAATVQIKHQEMITNRSNIKQKISLSLAQQQEITARIALISQSIAEHQAIIAAARCKKEETLPIYESIKTIESKIAQLTYDQKSHEHALERHQQIQAQLAHLDQLESVQAARKKEAILIYEQCKTAKKIKYDLHQKQTLLAATHQEIEALQPVAEQQTFFAQEWDRLNKKHAELLHTKGTLETRIQLFEQKKREVTRLVGTIKEYQCTIKDYQMIAHALSKDGIQALLIEEAIPEIEHEANMLLGRLTDNQAHLFIESLKDLKKGGSKETLDITISDQAGIRPYELFSGGEAFRIDFALRIAISKLLARRAGTTLQTLIIDEGFGSQDEEGLAAIMDVIHAIQDEFAKIIIISHLPTLKDQFPVHFVVEKKPQGSYVHVVQQG